MKDSPHKESAETSEERKARIRIFNREHVAPRFCGFVDVLGFGPQHRYHEARAQSRLQVSWAVRTQEATNNRDILSSCLNTYEE